MPEAVVEVLSRLPLFQGFDAEALQAVVPLLKSARPAAGQRLFGQGEAGRTAFIVVSGRIRVEVETPSRGAVQVASVGPGEPVGEVALVDPGPRSATAIATEPTVCVALTTEALKTLGRSRPDLVARILLNLSRTISARLRALDATLAAVMAVPPAGGTRGVR